MMVRHSPRSSQRHMSRSDRRPVTPTRLNSMSFKDRRRRRACRRPGNPILSSESQETTPFFRTGGPRRLQG
jgi:hypothetical protein